MGNPSHSHFLHNQIYLLIPTASVSLFFSFFFFSFFFVRPPFIPLFPPPPPCRLPFKVRLLSNNAILPNQDRRFVIDPATNKHCQGMQGSKAISPRLCQCSSRALVLACALSVGNKGYSANRIGHISTPGLFFVFVRLFPSPFPQLSISTTAAKERWTCQLNSWRAFLRFR